MPTPTVQLKLDSLLAGSDEGNSPGSTPGSMITPATSPSRTVQSVQTMQCIPVPVCFAVPAVPFTPETWNRVSCGSQTQPAAFAVAPSCLTTVGCSSVPGSPQKGRRFLQIFLVRISLVHATTVARQRLPQRRRGLLPKGRIQPKRRMWRASRALVACAPGAGLSVVRRMTSRPRTRALGRRAMRHSAGPTWRISRRTRASSLHRAFRG